MIFSSIFDVYSFLNNISLKLKDILEYKKTHHIEPYLKLVIWTLCKTVGGTFSLFQLSRIFLRRNCPYHVCFNE